MKVNDLRVYNKLFQLALEVHELTMTFPRFEMYELGSQLRWSSNSAPANLAEGFDCKHTNIYLESISRAQGEIRETLHYLKVALKKGYMTQEKFDYFLWEYEDSSRMLFGLEQSLVQSLRSNSSIR